MKKSLVFASLCFGLSCASLSATANDKVQSIYDANRNMQVCKGKSQGDHVSFAYRGIIWNGTCQPQFFPNNKKAVTGEEAELYTTCQNTSGASMATIDGKEVKGKCALGFTSPQPK